MNSKGKYLIVILLCLPISAMADFWLNSNQKGQQALDEGRPNEAASLFERPDWQGVAEYRAGEYDEALQRWVEAKTADGYFNQGNALAQKGQYEKAIAEYDKALELEVDMADAQFNKELMEKLLQQQEQQEKEQEQESDKQDQDNKDQQQDQQQSKDGDQPQDEQNNQEPQSSDQDNKGDQEPQPQEPQDNQGQEENSDNKPQDDTPKEQNQQPENSEQDQNAKQSPPVDSEVSEEDQATEQWLRQIPDDPGGLLRRKFQRDYQLRLQGRK